MRSVIKTFSFLKSVQISENVFIYPNMLAKNVFINAQNYVFFMDWQETFADILGLLRGFAYG